MPMMLAIAIDELAPGAWVNVNGKWTLSPPFHDIHP